MKFFGLFALTVSIFLTALLYGAKTQTHTVVGDVSLDQSAGGTATLGNVTFQKLTDTANSAYFVDPAATGDSLVLAGTATASGNLTVGNASAIRSAFGPLSLQYKSSLNAWTTGLTLQDTTGNVGINQTNPTLGMVSIVGKTNSESAIRTGVLHIASGNNVGGGSGYPEYGLHVNYANSFNSSGLVAGVYSYANQNIGNVSYGVYGESAGGATTSNSSGVYGKATQTDTNGYAFQYGVTGEGAVNISVANNGGTYSFRAIVPNYVGSYAMRVEDAYTGATSKNMFLFARNNSTIGSISTTTTSTAYNTSSDLRLKKNIATTTAGLATILKIPVNDFNFISDPNHRVQGFIAQDLYNYYPEAVNVGGDDPIKNPWSVDYGRITPLLVKGIQEQQEQIKELKARVTALESR